MSLKRSVATPATKHFSEGFWMPTITLVNPPQRELKEPLAYPPIGLCYLAAIAEEKYDCQIENLADGIRELDYADIFGITCSTACIPSVSKLVKQIRANHENSVVMVGGPHPTVAPADAAKRCDVDYVVRGEGEPLMNKLHTLRRQRKPVIIDAGYVKNLDALPLPARYLLDEDTVVNLSGIHGSDKPSTAISSSRGCPYRCTYCCKGHPMYVTLRLRSSENVLRELTHLKTEYGIEHIRFVDDTFTFDKRRTIAIANGIKDLDMTFICMTRADKIDEEVANALGQGRCTQVQLGIETASPRLLKRMNKGETVRDYERAMTLLTNAGVSIKALLIMNYPTESEEDRLITLKFLNEFKPSTFNLSWFTPLPGSGIRWMGETSFFYPDENKSWIEYREQIQEAIT